MPDDNSVPPLRPIRFVREQKFTDQVSSAWQRPPDELVQRIQQPWRLPGSSEPNPDYLDTEALISLLRLYQGTSREAVSEDILAAIGKRCVPLFRQDMRRFTYLPEQQRRIFADTLDELMLSISSTNGDFLEVRFSFQYARIVQHAVERFERDRARERRTISLDEVVFDPTVASPLVDKPTLELIVEDMADLVGNERHREAFRLMYKEGMTTREIATRMGVTADTVRDYIKDVKDRVREQWRSDT